MSLHTLTCPSTPSHVPPHPHMSLHTLTCPSTPSHVHPNSPVVSILPSTSFEHPINCKTAWQPLRYRDRGNTNAREPWFAHSWRLDTMVWDRLPAEYWAGGSAATAGDCLYGPMLDASSWGRLLMLYLVSKPKQKNRKGMQTCGGWKYRSGVNARRVYVYMSVCVHGV